MAKGVPRAAHAAKHAPTTPETIERRTPSTNFPAEYSVRSHSTHSIGHSARSSRLTSIVVPYFRRPPVSEGIDMSTQKTPRLTLKLTSLSFLDSEIHDDRTRHLLYVIKTTGTSTCIKRSDPWGGASQKAAMIKWPRMIPSKTKDKQSLGILVQMKGDNWREGDVFLRQSSISNGHKFSIPQYSHSLKWKKVGSSYWCTAPSCKGPIAILDPHIETVPPRLRVYETLHDKYDNGALAVYGDVSILLLDYLLVTALLLVTDIQEWMVVQKYEGDDAESSRNGHVRATSTTTDQLSIHAPRPSGITQSRWRKILNGEPLFPKLNLQRSMSVSTAGYTPPTPTSVHQMAKIIHGEPLYPNLRTPTPDSLMSASDDENDDDRSSISHIPSPIASSIYFPPAGAPSHNYFDPTFYDTSDAPPVPPLPAKYTSVSRGPSMLVDSASTHSAPRSLPTPPKSASTPLPPIIQPWLRSQSTPPEEPPPALHTQLRPSTSSGLPTSPPRSRSTRSNSMSRHHSIMSNSGFPRRLPDPPTQTPTPPPTQSPAPRSRTLPSEPSTPTRSTANRSSAVPRSLPPTPVQSSVALPSQQLLRTEPSSSSLSSRYVADGVTASPRATRRVLRDKDPLEMMRRQRPPTIRESVFDREAPPAYSSLDFAS